MKQKMYSCDARVILSILIGLFLSCNVFAQDVTIKGNVKDAKGEPIIGASKRNYEWNCYRFRR